MDRYKISNIADVFLIIHCKCLWGHFKVVFICKYYFKLKSHYFLFIFREISGHFWSKNKNTITCFDSAFFSLSEEVNVVNESTETVSVGMAISTNFIGQKEKVASDVCERSCGEINNMVQELKGLRIVVGNLIDGLQKVVNVLYLMNVLHLKETEKEHKVKSISPCTCSE